jgi:hypothetical protein
VNAVAKSLIEKDAFRSSLCRSFDNVPAAATSHRLIGTLSNAMVKAEQRPSLACYVSLLGDAMQGELL